MGAYMWRGRGSATANISSGMFEAFCLLGFPQRRWWGAVRVRVLSPCDSAECFFFLPAVEITSVFGSGSKTIVAVVRFAATHPRRLLDECVGAAVGGASCPTRNCGLGPTGGERPITLVFSACIFQKEVYGLREADNCSVLHMNLPGKGLWSVVWLVMVLAVVPACSAVGVCVLSMLGGRGGNFVALFFQGKVDLSSLLVVA
ncbi:unnamed protein product [Ectocarpus sp. 12 AP-2014]